MISIRKHKAPVLTALLIAACSRAPAVEPLEGPRSVAKQSADPAIVIEPSTGDLLLSWVEGDSAGYRLMFARSKDEGATWSDAVPVTIALDEVKPHAEASPRMVSANGVVGIFWPKQQHIPGRRFPASHMRFARSTDGGATWTQPITINDDTTSTEPAGHTFHGATAIGNSFVVAWLDSRRVTQTQGSHGAGVAHQEHEGSSYVYSATSRDLGATWAPANRKFWGNACPCCRVSLAPIGDDILAAWRGHFDGDVRDVVTARLTADSKPERVHADNWVFPGCPHSGPGLAVENNRAHITWFTGAPGKMGVYYKHPDREPVRVLGGEQLPAGHPVVTLLGDDALIAVNLSATGERMLSVARVSGDKVELVEVPNTNGADHPQLVRISDDRALLAWTQNAHIKLARVSAR